MRKPKQTIGRQVSYALAQLQAAARNYAADTHSAFNTTALVDRAYEYTTAIVAALKSA